MHNKYFILCCLLLKTIVSNAADWYVNQSGAPGTFTTIQGAILVAAPNDRIFVSPYDLYSENLTITKNVTIAPATSGQTIQLSGTVTVNGYPSRLVNIIGMNAASFTVNTGTATNAQRAVLNLTQCSGPAIGQENTALNMYFCTGGQSVEMRYGSIYGSIIGELQVKDESGSNAGDTITIIANKLTAGVWSSDNHYFFISNNYLGGYLNCSGVLYEWSRFSFNLVSYSASIQNNLLNNTFHGNERILYFIDGVNWSNVKIYNNILSAFNKGGDWWIYCNSPSGGAANGSPDVKNNIFIAPNNGCSGCENLVGPGINNVSYEPTPGAMNYRFTGFQRNDVNPHFPTNVFDPNTGKIGSLLSNYVNKGNPNIKYQDIDISRNDPGTYGGPYTWENYFNNTSSGKARIYNLDFPSEIWPGQTPTIKAGAVHTN